jgi:hypothetical protein
MNSNDINNDERHGVPSASYMNRIANCPPSFRLGQQFEDPSTRDAKSGDVTHKAIEVWPEPIEGLDHHQIQTAEMCIDARNELLDNWVGDGDYTSHKERRLGLTILGKCIDVVEGKPVRLVFSGKADYTAISADGKSGLVIDYKTLHGDHDGAAENAQLRSLAVLIHLRHGLEHVRVALVQPWKGRPTVADFDAQALKDAYAWLLASLEAERKSTPDQTKIGDWCKFCPARVKCLAKPVIATVESKTTGVESMDPETARKALFARAGELSDEELAARYRGLKMISWYVSAIEGNVRLRAAEGGSFAEHFVIKEGKGKEAISDVAKVWSRLAALGVTPEAFTAECKTTKKGVSLLTRKATGLKGASLESEIRKVLEGAVKVGNPVKKIVAAGASLEDGDDDEEGGSEE